MRFKLDENLPSEAASLLTEAGHDAVTVLAQNLGGTSDELLYSRCLDEARAIVTLDLDFADIRTYPPESSPGILVLRLARQDKQSVTAALSRVILLLDREPLSAHLWIVEADNVRVRGTEESI